MHRNYLIGLLLTVVLIVSSCTTKKMYEGPQLPSDKVAIIKSGSGGIFGPTVKIVYVDERSPGFNDIQLAVLPGKHTLEIAVIRGFEFTWIQSAGVLYFEAEAGHTYIVKVEKFFLYGSPIAAWLEDAETGEVVAGRKPQ